MNIDPIALEHTAKIEKNAHNHNSIDKFINLVLCYSLECNGQFSFAYADSLVGMVDVGWLKPSPIESNWSHVCLRVDRWRFHRVLNMSKALVPLFPAQETTVAQRAALPWRRDLPREAALPREASLPRLTSHDSPPFLLASSHLPRDLQIPSKSPLHDESLYLLELIANGAH